MGPMQSLDFTLRDLIGRKCRILLQSLFDEGATRAWILRRIGTVIAMALPQAQYVGGNIVNLFTGQVEIWHPAVRCLQEGSQRHRRGRFHVRDSSKRRRAGAGTAL